MEESKWSEKACAGYCIAAMQLAGYSHTEIEAVLDKMQSEFKRKTVAEAEAFVNDFLV